MTSEERKQIVTELLSMSRQQMERYGASNCKLDPETWLDTIKAIWEESGNGDGAGGDQDGATDAAMNEYLNEKFPKDESGE